MSYYTILAVYLTVINIITFIVFGIDKNRAIMGEWRIPEKTLLLLTIVGGSVGALLGMTSFQHKTKKPLFTLVVPLALIVHIFLVMRFIDAF